ncbi:DMXL1 [Cordylochernes scorpioides]|uniref:DMXL1 n=1 Tax=Cordylochernes scorpioides TaxID=51811 RepID=A0ABY6KT91_9ARAC|nr:DMXL1 [Cordylochernes scorpioides]
MPSGAALLLTTSHHKPAGPGLHQSRGQHSFQPLLPTTCQQWPSGLCSELILWKVEPVGPLSKSGGIMELARINSFKTAAFDNVAWIPTLAPQLTLGGISNSPSACFVASDGEQLRVYQAVIDARTLLAEISSASAQGSQGLLQDPSLSGSTSSDLEFPVSNLHEVFNIVSLQSTARPGCIIELDSISHAHHRRRRESPNRPVEQRSSGVAASRRAGATPRRRPTAGGAMVVQEIRATRADIADARVQQRFSTEDNCVFVEHCPDFGYTHYLQAVEELVGGAGNVLQVMKMDGHMLVGLSTKALAERLLRDGLEIGHTHLRAFPVKKRAERITVANLPFFVDDAAVIEALKPFGDVSSIAPIRLRAGRYTFTDGRREVFILLKEGFTLEKIPTRVVIRNKGNVLSAFISYGVKCSRCGRQGHRRANCPINPGRASNNGQPQPAPLPPGASSTVSRQQSRPTPAAPALPMEETPSAPPTSASRSAGPRCPAWPSARPEDPRTCGPTPDVEMSIVEETFASSTSSAKNATRVDLDAFIEGHPSVSFAETDALGLEREEVLDLLSSRTKAQRKGPLLSPPQCDALVGLIGQILDLRPRAASNLYKVLGQVKAELRITPAVPPTPPLPAPRPAETARPLLKGRSQHQLKWHIRLHCQMGVWSWWGPHLQAVVDLRTASDFQEPFFLVVLEKEDSGQSVLHMWRLVVSSMCSAAGNVQTEQEEIEKTSRSNSPTFAEESSAHQPHAQPLKITTTKPATMDGLTPHVCTQALPLPPDVEVVHATPSAGHLSSSNIYPACYAPYLISTACTDGSVRFWYCDVTTSNGNDVYTWLEWEMLLNRKSSEISVPGKSQLFKISFNRVIAAAGQPLYVSSCYSGRMACAYKHGHSFMRPTSDDPNSRYVNLSVAIFECESTGGSEWLNLTMDWDILVDTSVKNRKTAGALIERLTSQEDYLTEEASNLGRMLSVPSYSTLYTLRKAIAEKGNQCMLTQKSLVQLDWVSTEDGSHVLTVTVGSKVIIFTPVSTDIAQANVQAMKASKSSNRPLIKQASSMAAPLLHGDEVRWMKIRTTHLSTADGLPPLPMQISWVRDGIFVVGMDNEMQIFSQWRIPNEEAEVKEQEGVGDGRNLIEKELISRAQESSQLRIPGSMSRTTSATLLASASSASDLHKKSKDSSLPPSNEKDRRTDSLTGLGALPDFGLFEACRLACPVLPQYHPKQLNELLGFGKLRRVKAILSHLVRCLAGTENIKTFLQVPEESKDSESDGGGSRSWSRSRALSLAANSSPLQQASPLDSVSMFPEEILLDYVEITSIPPLPLFTLLAADKETSQTSRQSVVGKPPTSAQDSKVSFTAAVISQDYSDLFDIPVNPAEENLDEYLDKKFPATSERKRHTSAGSKEQSLLTHFGPKQALLLTKLLTHSHLPGLSSLDQMHLLALADTVASFSTALSDRLDSERPAAVKGATASNSGGLAIQVTTDSLDDCGLRFLLSMRHYTYLLRCLPFVQRAQLQQQGLGAHSLVWAFHSETQEELIQLLPCVQRGNPKWPELRELGIGWWIRSNAVLRRLIEKAIKAVAYFYS